MYDTERPETVEGRVYELQNLPSPFVTRPAHAFWREVVETPKCAGKCGLTHEGGTMSGNFVFVVFSQGKGSQSGRKRWEDSEDFRVWPPPCRDILGISLTFLDRYHLFDT